jgi:hypothetical protein
MKKSCFIDYYFIAFLVMTKLVTSTTISRSWRLFPVLLSWLEQNVDTHAACRIVARWFMELW